jgi:phospholipid transport system substrate-binding protein
MRMLAIGVAAAVLAVASPARVGAVTAMDEMRRHTDQVLRVLQDETLTPAGRRIAVRDIAGEAFDLAGTARRALGRHWHARTGAEREEFVRLFREVLERTYLPWIDLYRGEEVRYVTERHDGDYAAVRAMIVTRFGVEVPVELRVQRQGDRWRIYDVLVESMSLVASYRSRFDRIIRNGSYEALVRHLKAELERLVPLPPRGTAQPARR